MPLAPRRGGRKTDGTASDQRLTPLMREPWDLRFRLGPVDRPWRELARGPGLRWLLAGSVAEALPGCSDCAFVPFCGADPVFHAHAQGDPVGHRPTSDFCRKHTGLFRLLFGMLAASDPGTMRVFAAWLSGRRVADVRHPGLPC